MTSQANNNNTPGPFERVALFIFLAAVLLLVFSCSPKWRVETKIEYRDRIVRDTTTVEITHEVEKIVTRDTVSRLENSYAKSDVVVSGGFLYHSLESKPQVIEVPVEVTVTDTLYKEAQIVEKEVEIEKPLSWWQKFRLSSFWWLVASVVALLAWALRKVIF